MLYVIIVLVIIGIFASLVKIVPQTQAYVIEFLGKYSRTLTAGLNLKIPGLERVVKRVNLKEQVADFEPQPVITKDNVTMQIDTVVYYKVFDPRLFTYGVENPIRALELLTATTLRNIVGGMELDDTLTSRDKINAEMLTILDEATDPWGIKVNRVEIKNIVPPKDIQDTMEKQMRAERERRETKLQAESHREAAVLRAEGDKQAAILKAEAERDAAIARAKGQAESIRLVYEAESRGLKMLADAGINGQVIAIKKLEALKELGKGQATKIVVPTDITNLATDMTVKGELLDIADKASSIAPGPMYRQPDDCCDDEDRTEVTKTLTMSPEERNAYLQQKLAEQRQRNGGK